MYLRTRKQVETAACFLIFLYRPRLYWYLELDQKSISPKASLPTVSAQVQAGPVMVGALRKSLFPLRSNDREGGRMTDTTVSPLTSHCLSNPGLKRRRYFRIVGNTGWPWPVTS